eukprot:scaffold35_cov117-Skeletonema_dohrnii-CCMP3373.AAC.2
MMASAKQERCTSPSIKDASNALQSLLACCFGPRSRCDVMGEEGFQEIRGRRQKARSKEPIPM